MRLTQNSDAFKGSGAVKSQKKKTQKHAVRITAVPFDSDSNCKSTSAFTPSHSRIESATSSLCTRHTKEITEVHVPYRIQCFGKGACDHLIQNTHSMANCPVLSYINARSTMTMDYMQASMQHVGPALQHIEPTLQHIRPENRHHKERTSNEFPKELPEVATANEHDQAMVGGFGTIKYRRRFEPGRCGVHGSIYTPPQPKVCSRFPVINEDKNSGEVGCHPSI